MVWAMCPFHDILYCNPDILWSPICPVCSPSECSWSILLFLCLWWHYTFPGESQCPISFPMQLGCWDRIVGWHAYKECSREYDTKVLWYLPGIVDHIEDSDKVQCYLICQFFQVLDGMWEKNRSLISSDDKKMQTIRSTVPVGNEACLLETRLATRQASFPTGTLDRRIWIFLSQLNINDEFYLTTLWASMLQLSLTVSFLFQAWILLNASLMEWHQMLRRFLAIFRQIYNQSSR